MRNWELDLMISLHSLHCVMKLCIVWNTIQPLFQPLSGSDGQLGPTEQTDTHRWDHLLTIQVGTQDGSQEG